MTMHRFFPMTLIVLAVLAGCNTTPASNEWLTEARNDYRVAQDNPQTRDLASGEMKQAGDALNVANEAWKRNESTAEVNHLAYLAKQRIAIAQEMGKQKSAELAVTNAEAGRDKIRLAARTNEADMAQRNAQTAQRQSEASQRSAQTAQRQSEESQRSAQTAQRQSEESQRQSEVSKRQAEASGLQAQASQQQASDAAARNSALEAQLKELNAKKTERGLVITIGDVLFDTNQAELKAGGLRSVEKLGSFLKQYPQRKALVEGFTDSVGSESSNEMLSGRRAVAVRRALIEQGVTGDRIATHGYGEAYPVASNDNPAGRQLNRRVEIVLSDDSGNISQR
jgi:outer membrane protein OmpA-like peptidoglycan-associated protein